MLRASVSTSPFWTFHQILEKLLKNLHALSSLLFPQTNSCLKLSKFNPIFSYAIHFNIIFFLFPRVFTFPPCLQASASSLSGAMSFSSVEDSCWNKGLCGFANAVVAWRMSGKREPVTSWFLIRQGMRLLRKEAKTKVKGRNKLKWRL
jgi:hypothetical protein